MAKKAAKKVAKKSTGVRAVDIKYAPSHTLGQLIGKGKVTRGQVMKKIWDYIKGQDLQNPKNKRNILLDNNLKILFADSLKRGQKEITMFELGGLLNPHLEQDGSSAASKKTAVKKKANPSYEYDEDEDEDEDDEYEEEDEDDDEY